MAGSEIYHGVGALIPDMIPAYDSPHQGNLENGMAQLAASAAA